MSPISTSQIQKYETGANRIGASRRFQFAQILNVYIQYFFEDATNDNKTNERGDHRSAKTKAANLGFLRSRDGLELNKAFSKINDPEVRKRIIDLVRVLARESG